MCMVSAYVGRQFVPQSGASSAGETFQANSWHVLLLQEDIGIETDDDCKVSIPELKY